jgi:hypothetical protein
MCISNDFNEDGEQKSKLNSFASIHLQYFIHIHACHDCTSQASEREMFNHHYQWLFIDEHDDKVTSSNTTKVVEFLSALNVSVSSQIALFRTMHDSSAMTLFDVW